MATKNFNLAKLARNINIEDDGSIAFTSEVSAGGETIGSLTASMDSDQTSTITLSKASTPVPIVQAYKEIPQVGISSKGQWNVNANATNYDFYDEKPISYASATLTPSATGDGTFTNSAANTTYYDVANATYDNVSNAQYTQLTGAHSTIFNNNGTKAYVTATYNNGSIFQYSLSTAYDVSTNTYDSKTYAFSQFTYPTASRFNGDGTKLYTVAWNGAQSSSRVYQYSLSTAYDISTASYDSVNLDMTAHRYAWGFTFNNDGSKVFVSIVENNLSNSGRVAEYSLSTNYDLSTAGSQTLHILSGTGWYNYGIEFNNDGTKLFVNNNDDAPTKGPHVFTLTTAYDISTTSYTNTNADVNTLYGSSMGAGDITFNNDGTKMYISDTGNGYVRQFSVSTSTAFNAADVGKKVVGNSGSAIITATSGTYQSVTAFADTSTISSWQLFGAQGKSDGSGIVFTQAGAPGGIPTTFSSLSGPHTVSGQSAHGFHWSKDGTYYYIINQSNTTIYRYICTTPWDVTTVSAAQTLSAGGSGSKYGITVSEDGKHIYHGTYNEQIVHIPLSTAHDLTTAGSHTTYTVTGSYSGGSNPGINPSNANPWDMWVNSNGTKIWSLINGVSTRDTIIQFSMSTAYDISTASYENHFTMSPDGNDRVKLTNDGSRLYVTDNNAMRYWNLSPAYTLPANGTSPTNITLPAGGGTGKFFDEYYFHTASSQVNRYTLDTNIETSSTTPAYNQYFPALTNSSNGQINSSAWLDINSMTADETKNGGDIFYAVSTDNRTSWGVAKASDGVRKIAKNNSGTWQYNNDAGVTVSIGYDLSSISPDNKYWDISHNTGYDYHGIHMGADGYHLYGVNQDDDFIRVWDLTTQWDISSAVYYRYRTSHLTQPRALALSVDGTKMYCSQNTGDVRQYELSTAWDLTTYSGGTSTAANLGSLDHIVFKPDGTRVWTYYNRIIKEYSISTAWDLTSTVTLVQTVTSTDTTYLNSGSGKTMAWNADGTAFFEAGGNNKLQRVPCSTAWDISTMQSPNQGLALNSLSYSNTAWGSNPCGDIQFGDNGQKLYLYEDNKKWVRQFSTSGTTTSYTTSETWVNGTNNNEHATVQESLGAQSFNRMNKAQLDAVADAYHFSQDSADTLDLMIAPYAASGTSPISDGVTINYDAASKYRQAVPETDYRADFAGTSTVEFTSNISANFKVKVV